MLQNFLNTLGDLQSKAVNPYDNDYPQYRLPAYISSERIDHSQSGELDPNKERAFSIANKVIVAIHSNNLKDADEMVYQSYYFDPFCVDAWRVMINILFNQYSDGETLVTATRELLHFSRRFYQLEFQQVGKFYTIQSTRPYIRILCDMARAANHGLRFEVATYTYEEILRLNHLDELNIRDPLLCCYLKLIGISQRFSNLVKPIRTIYHAKQLINCVFHDDKNEEPFHLFEENNIIVRWANLCFLYLDSKKDGNSDTWKKEAKKEFGKNELIFKLLFNEIDIPYVDPTAPKIARNLQVQTTKTDLEGKGGLIKEFLIQCWPDFLLDLYKLFKGEKVPESFKSNIDKMAYVPTGVMPPFYKSHMKDIAENYLNKGRKLLSNREFEEALKNFVHSKVSYIETIFPSKRWYLHAPFAIASNMTTSALHLKRWNFFRIFLRFTLKMKPDHEKSYLKLPKLAEVYKAEQLVEEFNDISQNVKDKKINDTQKWKELADRVIGLTSMTALAFAAANKLTDEMKEELIKIGIEDCYTTINVGTVHPLLPWLTVDDLEQPIPNI